MSAPKIKLCGINDVASLEAAIAARADYVGFNFYAPSPRFIRPNLAKALGWQASGKVQRVGVFVNATHTEIHDGVEAGCLDVVQLHGSESPADAATIRDRFDCLVWKVLSVSTAADIARADTYKGAVDMVLFDAKTPKDALPGGMGLRFDWSLLSACRGAMSWGLAGGLTADNVADAIRQTGATLVDTASGIESAAGIKDPAKIAAFCAAVRSA